MRSKSKELMLKIRDFAEQFTLDIEYLSYITGTMTRLFFRVYLYVIIDAIFVL